MRSLIHELKQRLWYLLYFFYNVHMKTFKKLFAYSAIFALLATMMPTYANAASYDAELTEAYAYAKNKWITTMTSIDNADMYGNLTRVAMAKMVANYVLDLGLQELDTDKECNFPDVSASLDEAYDNGVTKACQLGLMGVGIEKFNPNGIVTRAEFGTVLSRALWGDEYNDATPYYKAHLEALKAEGIMTKIDNPEMKEVRGYVMIMMQRADEDYTPAVGCSAEELLACILADDYDACIAACSEDADEEDLPGYATVSTKAAAAQTVALNAVDKKVWTVTLKAGENDTTVANIEITKSGLWKTAGIVGIQLVKNGEYVTNQVRPNADNVAKLRFKPSLVIKAGKSETFDVVVSTTDDAWAVTAGWQYDFSVTALNVANGKFSWTPAKLGSITTTNYMVGTTTVAVANGTVSAWDKAKEIGTITLTPSANATINSVILSSNQDELYNAFSNVKAYINWEEVGKVTVNDEDIVISDLNIPAERNEDVEISLKADITFVGAPSSTFDFYVDDNHVNAVEKNTNERMSNVRTPGAPGVSTLTVNGVGLTLKNNVTKAQTVSANTKNVILLDIEVTSSSDIDVTDYYVDFGATYAALVPAIFDDIVVDIDGSEYNLTAFDEGAATKYTLSAKSDAFSVSAKNSARIQVKAKATWAGTSTLTFGVNTIKNTDNNTNVPWNPLTSKAWHKTTVKASGWLNASKWTVPSSNTVEEWSENDALSFKLKATSEDILVTAVKLEIAALWLWEDLSSLSKIELKQWDSVLATEDDFSTFTVECVTSMKNMTQIAAAKCTASQITVWNVNHITKTVAKADEITMNINQSIKADERLPFTVVATLNNGDVVNLWSTLQIDLATVTAKWKTSNVASAVTGTPVAGKAYQIVTEKPEFTITKNWENIEVTIKNNSSYDIEVASFDVKVVWNVIDGENMLTKSVDTTTTNTNWFLRDAIGSITNMWTVGVMTSSVVTLTPTVGVYDTIWANDEKTFVIEMASTANVDSSYYEATAKAISYIYTDWTDGSSAITATY